MNQKNIDTLQSTTKPGDHPESSPRGESLQSIFEKLDNIPGLMTPQEVCKLLGCHQQTLYDWTRQGRISAFLIGRGWRYDPADVYYFLTKRRLRAKGVKK